MKNSYCIDGIVIEGASNLKALYKFFLYIINKI